MADRPNSLTIRARGHPNVRATHSKTFELTSDEDVTQSGTCIVGVGAEIDLEAAAALRGRVEITLGCGPVSTRTKATINPLYVPGDPLIFRKDDRPKGRALTIDTVDGASNLDRDLVEALRAPDAELTVELRVIAPATTGVVFLVGVPIGNDEDLTPRARRVLEWADVIACEDTRTSRPLLDRIGTRGRRISYHDHNERERAEELAQLLAGGARIAVVSDAGMPGLSDPGHHLARAAHDIGAIVQPVPGPNAAICALVASGLPTDSFTFAGFVPRTNKARTEALQRFAKSRSTIVVYEAPHRAAETLEAIAEHYGDRDVTVARELTKTNEEIATGPAAQLLESLREGDRLRGEMTLVLPPGETPDEDDVPEWLEPMCRALLDADVPKKAIAAAIRAALGWPKKRGYHYVLALDAG